MMNKYFHIKETDYLEELIENENIILSEDI